MGEGNIESKFVYFVIFYDSNTDDKENKTNTIAPR